MKGQTEEVAVYLRFKKKNTTQTSVEGWNSLCGLFVADSLTICKCMCFKIKHIFSVFRGKSQSNSLPVTHAIGLSWHQGLFRVRWRKLHLQGVGCFSWIFFFFCQCKPKYKRILCSARVRGPGSRPAGLRWQPVHTPGPCGSTQHGDGGTLTEPGPRHGLLRGPASSCLVASPRELTRFLNLFLTAEQWWGFIHTWSVVLFLWYEQVPAKSVGCRPPPLHSPPWVQLSKLQAVLNLGTFRFVVSVCWSVYKAPTPLLWYSWQEFLLKKFLKSSYYLS